MALELQELLEETKARNAAVFRVMMDPNNKYRGMSVKQILEEKRLDQIDGYLRKRRAHVEYD